MHIVALAWMFVVLLMTAAEATSTQGTVLGAMFMRDGGNPIVAALIMILAGLGVGAINGYAVAYFRMIPFVVTLAMERELSFSGPLVGVVFKF